MTTKAEDHLPSLAYARKALYDYLDRTRPWAVPGVDAYEMMEQIVDEAAWAFRSDRRPTWEQVRELETALLRITAMLPQHPDDYEGPCACPDCRDLD